MLISLFVDESATALKPHIAKALGAVALQFGLPDRRQTNCGNCLMDWTLEILILIRKKMKKEGRIALPEMPAEVLKIVEGNAPQEKCKKYRLKKEYAGGLNWSGVLINKYTLNDWLCEKMLKSGLGKYLEECEEEFNALDDSNLDA